MADADLAEGAADGAAGGAGGAAAAGIGGRRNNNDVIGAEQHSMAEMFTTFPHESAIVMRRGIELGVVCSCILVTHCVVVTLQHWDSEVELDILLRVLAVLRILCATPRPYFWFHTRAQFIEARYQPTPQLVARRLLAIYNKQSRIEKLLFAFYYSWLLGVALVTLLVPVNPAQGYSQGLWRHCVLNVLSLIVHRLGCVSLFYYLMHCDLMRGIPKDVVNKYTSRFHWEAEMRANDQFMRWTMGGKNTDDAADCAICYGPYSTSEEIRRLKCGHTFHLACVDTWLLGHQNKCPLCGFVVGPHVDWEEMEQVE